jgi:hypothetical protein
VIGAIADVKPQAGGNVTKGYKGGMQVDHVPITTPYWKNEMCPVNVHWHLGTKHYSAGEYDEFGSGPVQNNYGLGDRRLAEAEARKGYQCRYYDLDDNKFNTPYVWKHCVGMRIGETYEVHWPHSAAGMCGTPNQYQTPFYDGSSASTASSPTRPPRSASRPRSSPSSTTRSTTTPTSSAA